MMIDSNQIPGLCGPNSAMLAIHCQHNGHYSYTNAVFIASVGVAAFEGCLDDDPRISCSDALFHSSLKDKTA